MKFNATSILYRMDTSFAALTAATEAIMVPDVQIMAGYLSPGTILRATIWGKQSNAVTTPGTLTLRARWGGVAGTLLCTSGALTQNVIAQTDKTFKLVWEIECMSLGAAGGTAAQLLATGYAIRRNRAAAVVADISPDIFPENTPAAVSANVAADTSVSFTAEPSLGTASIQAMRYRLEAMSK